MWQLSWIPLTDADLARIAASMPAYRKQDEKVRRLNEELRQHERFDDLHRAQTRLWKTPEYHSVHRRYSGRLRELNRIYGGGPVAGKPLIRSYSPRTRSS